MSDTVIRAAIEALQLRYVGAIDGKNMPGWLACFAEDGSYLCQSRENHERDLPIGYMWDNCHARLQDRVKTIDQVWHGTAEDYQPRHIVQVLSVEPGEHGLHRAVTNFVVFYTTNHGDSRILATGEYLDRLRIADGQALLVERKAILDQITMPRYLVYPI